MTIKQKEDYLISKGWWKLARSIWTNKDYQNGKKKDYDCADIDFAVNYEKSLEKCI